MKNESPQKQLVSKIKSVNNILVTVSRNPTVDQLVSALGLTLALNKMDKRSVAVFSGELPSAIHFLHPEKTFEDNADSLRDFIISLSKDKADRLKVRPDGEFVKVYITPYRTKITPDDLRFDEGDFNIELIIAIGVGSRDELDASIASHGKIFHNAVTATLNIGQLHDALGMISWQDGRLGCYAEMCYDLIDELGEGKQQLVDEPVATALLTGVVSATDQFRNSITSPAIMTLSANLMARGANQQLITAELKSSDDGEHAQSKGGAMPADDDKYASISFDRNSNRNDGRQNDNPARSDQIDGVRSGDFIERQLQEGREELGEQRSADALRVAQDKLRQIEQAKPADTARTDKIKAPEAPRLDEPAVIRKQPLVPAESPAPVVQPQPANVPVPPRPAKPARPAVEAPVVPPKPDDVPVPPAPAPAPAPAHMSAPIPAPVPKPMPAPAVDERPQYVGEHLPQMDALLSAADEAPVPMGSGSYVIDDNEPATPSRQDDDLPFNQPNQVSPIQPADTSTVPALPPMPDLTQPINMGQPNSMMTPTMASPLDRVALPPMPDTAGSAVTPVQPPIEPVPTPLPGDNSDITMPLPPMPPMPPAPADPVTPGLPPMPPAPTNSAMGGLPPVPPVPPVAEATPAPANPAGESPVAQPTTPTNDPSQFVIPS